MILLLIFKIRNSANISAELEDFLNKIRSYAAVVFGYNNITRFGFIGQYFYKTSEPVENIQSKYFKSNIGHLEELNVRYNKRFDCNGLILNDIVELGKGTFIESQGMQDGILILKDINNVPSDGLLPIEDVFSTIKSKLTDFGVTGITEILR